MNKIRFDQYTLDSLPGPVHVTPSLRELYLYSEMVSLWEYYSSPNLRRLRLPCDDEASEELYQHSVGLPRLSYLYLSIEEHFSVADLLVLLRLAPPVLTELKIEYTHAKDFAIDIILIALRDDALVPRLTDFELVPNDGAREFPYGLLIEMLSVRCKGRVCAVLEEF